MVFFIELNKSPYICFDNTIMSLENINIKKTLENSNNSSIKRI